MAQLGEVVEFSMLTNQINIGNVLSTLWLICVVCVCVAEISVFCVAVLVVGGEKDGDIESSLRNWFAGKYTHGIFLH